METKFTPGPWRVGNHPESSRSDTVFGTGKNKVAYCQSLFGRPHCHYEEIEANARLIAAAPELLEALLAAEDRDQRGILNMTDAEIVRVHTLRRAAITKAIGQ